MSELGLRFANSDYLKFIAIPALMFVGWLWCFCSRRAEVSIFKKRRIVPLREKYLFAGPLLFWLCLIFSILLSIMALSRPQRLMSVVNENSVDLVIIQDGSASMYVKDVKPDRWGRAMSWVKTLVETLSWKGDRMALAVFAHKASPVIRLTNDPNVVMFFLDNLKQSPFALEDNITWDTNIEEGAYWGIKILAKDAGLYGKRGNSQAFIIISDGQVWSGKIEALFKKLRSIGPTYVIGVGTTVGGVIPKPNTVTKYYYDEEGNEVEYKSPQSPEGFPAIHSSIDRQSLRKIAITGGGEYFELGTESDANIAAKIIHDVQKKINQNKKKEIWEDWYWYFLVGVAFFLGLGIYAAYR